MPKLSVIIITFNEERNIGRCLQSIKEVADDIVVVDSFSTDGTEDICKKYGVRFFTHAFEGHIEQKNYALTLSQYPHVLSLDADEALDETLKKSILAAKANWDCDGYEMNRLTNYCGSWIKHCGWYPDAKLRMYEKSKGAWGGTNPHDKYELNTGTKLGHLKGDILHYSYYTIQDHYKQIEYFTNISSKELFKKGKHASIIKVMFSPVVKFIQCYFIKLGFLDGAAGFTICRLSAWAAYLKYSKLRKLYQAK